MNDTDAAWKALPGTAFPEKLASIGIERGRIIDIRDLDAIGRDYGIGIYLFFEKDLAVTRTLAEIQEEFRDVPGTSARMSRSQVFSGLKKRTTHRLPGLLRHSPS